MPPPLRAAAAHGISYRPITDADLPFVAAVYASTRQEELGQTGWPQPAIDAFLQQQHEAQHSHYRQHYADMEWLIVARDGMPIGRLYLHERESDVRVVDISLATDHRGAGLGGAILRDILDQAGARGKSVSIHVEKFNPARRLYDRLGFRTIEDQGVYNLCRWDPPPAADQ